MALQESYETNDDIISISGNFWVSQSFLTTSAYTLESVSLYCYRDGDPGTVTVSLYAEDGGDKPTGAALATVNITGTDLPNGVANQDWHNAVFSSTYNVSDATKYCIVVSCTGADSSNAVKWGRQVTGTYSDGRMCYSTNAGSSWSTTSADCTFRTYSEAGPVAVPISGSTSITFGGSGTLYSLLSLSGTTGITFSLTGDIAGKLALSGTAGITFGSSAILIFGPPDGGKIEKYQRYLVLIGNDCAYYESA